MERRKFLIGVGGTAIGGSALIGSGAFSRVESQRHVNIEVATDDEAYLGLVPLCDEETHDGGPFVEQGEGSRNACNYVDLDEKGHLYVDIGENGAGGQGVNSDSSTWFERMFRICNNGKATADIAIDVAGLTFHPSSINDGGEGDANDTGDGIDAYGRPIVDVYYTDENGDEQSILFDSDDETWYDFEDVALELDEGTCEDMHIRTNTKSIDANLDYPLVEGEALVVADSPGASQ